jgi:hypothetical protein
MKRLFPIGIAALLLATGTAHAVDIPKQYHGGWCPTKWQTIYKRCSEDEAEFGIESEGWGTGDSFCTLSDIRRSKYGGHRLVAICRNVSGAEGKRREERWWLGTHNTRLQIIGRN